MTLHFLLNHLTSLFVSYNQYIQKPEEGANVAPSSPEQDQDGEAEQGSNHDGNNEVEEEKLSKNNGNEEYTIETINDTTLAKEEESVHNNDVVNLRMFGAARQASHLKGG